MTTDTLQTIVARAAADAEFRGLLLHDPAQALAGYELSDSEASALKALTPESFDGSTAELEQRLSRSTGIIWGDAK